MRAHERVDPWASGDQAALRRVAAAVVTGDDPTGALDLAAREVAALVGAESGFLFRVDGDRVVIAGVWGIEGAPVGAAFEIERDGVLPRVIATGRPARVDGRDRPIGRHNSDVHYIACHYRGAIGAPVYVGETLWGVVVAATTTERAFPPGAEDRLSYFAEIAGIAIGSAEARAELARLAASDGLTGLANHRTFHARLEDEVDLAARHDAPLSLALIDLDHFKVVNDSHGHLAGDGVLVEIADRLRRLARRSDLIARVGGEEFAWLLPHTDARGALRAMRRVLGTVAGRPFAVAGPMTVSIGVAALGPAQGAGALYHSADQALYAAKEGGRNRVVVHGGTAVSGAAPRSEFPVPPAVRALARVIEIADPPAHGHCARVAALAHDVALRAGWEPARAALLRDAALVHELGVLAAPGPDGDAAVRARAAAQIAAGVLRDDQLTWIRGRFDPAAVEGGDLPEGARLLAAADAWDRAGAPSAEAGDGAAAAAWQDFVRRAHGGLDPMALRALGAALGHDPEARAGDDAGG